MNTFHIECDVKCGAGGWDRALFGTWLEEQLNLQLDPEDRDNLVSNVRITKVTE